MGDYDRALSTSDEAMRLNASLGRSGMQAHVIWARAQILRDLGRDEEAIALYRDGSSLKKERGQFIYLPLDLATLLWSKGEVEESLSIFDDLFL